MLKKILVIISSYLSRKCTAAIGCRVMSLPLNPRNYCPPSARLCLFSGLPGRVAWCPLLAHIQMLSSTILDAALVRNLEFCARNRFVTVTSAVPPAFFLSLCLAVSLLGNGVKPDSSPVCSVAYIPDIPCRLDAVLTLHGKKLDLEKEGLDQGHMDAALEARLRSRCLEFQV